MGYKKRYYVLFFTIQFIHVLHGASSSIAVKKIYYHRKDQPQTIEPGQLSVYFDSEPLIKEQNNRLKNGFAEQSFLISKTDIKDNKVIEMLNDINKNSRGNGYSISLIYDVNLHQVKIKITYNPKKITLAWDIYDAITEDKGLMIHLYDRVVLQKLKEFEPKLIRITKNSKPRVLLDCGHGGDDTGGIGCTGICEKDVCLQIGLTVASLLKKKGYEVLLTRKKDEFVSLPQRTYYAHSFNADLLISIHANYVPHANAQGVETFYLSETIINHNKSQLTSDEKHYLARYKSELLKKSNLLARTIHSMVIQNTRTHHSTVDRQVKSRVPQILVASEIPATLLEVGFLSHNHEGVLLTKKNYQKSIALGIVHGIVNYFESLPSTL